MAYPIIRIQSTGGSDTEASGAGPETALYGTSNASTSSDGLTVTLPSGTDLSNVLTDGSHVLFLYDTTAGARNFSQITSTAGSGGATPTIGVANPFGVSLSSKSWAIGGQRASVGSATSSLLFSNNSTAGDALPGWTVELQSGHSEVIGATFSLRRSGDVSDGPIILRGAVGAASRPVLTFTNNGGAIVIQGNISHIHLTDFELRNSFATKTASTAIALNGLNTPVVIRNLKIADQTENFWRGISMSSVGIVVEECELAYFTDVAITTASGNAAILCNWIHDCTSHGIQLTGGTNGSQITGNLIVSNGGDGIYDGRNPTATNILPLVVRHNTIHANAVHGLESTCTSSQSSIVGAQIENNIFSSNAGTALAYTGAGISDKHLQALAARIRNNLLYNNGASYSGITAASSQQEVNLDPAYRDTSQGDFQPNGSLYGLGYPKVGSLTVGTSSATDSYVGIGAALYAQAGGGLLSARGFTGGFAQ